MKIQLCHTPEKSAQRSMLSRLLSITCDNLLKNMSPEYVSKFWEERNRIMRHHQVIKSLLRSSYREIPTHGQW